MYHIISQTQQSTQQCSDHTNDISEWSSDSDDIVPFNEFSDLLISNPKANEFVFRTEQSTTSKGQPKVLMDVVSTDDTYETSKPSKCQPKVLMDVVSTDDTYETSKPSKCQPKVLMDVASVKAINQIISEEMASYKENRVVKQSHVDLTLEWSKTWEKAMKQQKKKRKKPLTVKEKKKIQCSKRIRKKRANFYRKYHNVWGSADLITLHVDDPELNGDPNLENYVDDFDVNQYL